VFRRGAAPFTIVLATQTAGVVFLPTPAAAFLAVLVMMAFMVSVRRIEAEVLEPVIVPYAVHVMNDFGRSQHPTKVYSHYQPVLQHVAIRAGHRVGRAHLDADVTTVHHCASASPSRRVTPGGKPTAPLCCTWSAAINTLRGPALDHGRFPPLRRSADRALVEASSFSAHPLNYSTRFHHSAWNEALA
jgi:hypothetical protein